jgi:hypothetical protein
MFSLRILFFVVLFSTLSSAFGAGTTIYVGPIGNDANKGDNEDKSVATIQRAMSLAEEAPGGTNEVMILLKPGTYTGQRFETRGHRENVPILITSGSGGHAVFDGGGQGGTWMFLKPRGGKLSNIRIHEIEVRRYETAIDVRGNRNNPEIWAGGLTIRDSRFIDIGSLAREGAPPSTAALRLVNSDHNVISGNYFSRIRNSELCGLLHAVYIAHGSTENLIQNNTFENSCGDAIRFRDRSSDNVVRDNNFIDAWSLSPVSDWFCNPKDRAERGGGQCTKHAAECPSYNNLLEKNRAISRSYPETRIFIPYGGKPPSECIPFKSAQRAMIR